MKCDGNAKKTGLEELALPKFLGVPDLRPRSMLRASLRDINTWSIEDRGLPRHVSHRNWLENHFTEVSWAKNDLKACEEHYRGLAVGNSSDSPGEFPLSAHLCSAHLLSVCGHGFRGQSNAADFTIDGETRSFGCISSLCSTV